MRLSHITTVCLAGLILAGCDGTNTPDTIPVADSPPAEPLSVAVLPGDAAQAEDVFSSSANDQEERTLTLVDIGSVAIPTPSGQSLNLALVFSHSAETLAELRSMDAQDWFERGHAAFDDSEETTVFEFSLTANESITESAVELDQPSYGAFLFVAFSSGTYAQEELAGAGQLIIELTDGALRTELAQ